MNTTGISFEEMLRLYNEPPADGKVVKIPDYIFNFNKWEFITSRRKTTHFRGWI